MFVVVVDDDRTQAESLIEKISHSPALRNAEGHSTHYGSGGNAEQNGADNSVDHLDIQWINTVDDLEKYCRNGGTHIDIAFMDIQLHTAESSGAQETGTAAKTSTTVNTGTAVEENEALATAGITAGITAEGNDANTAPAGTTSTTSFTAPATPTKQGTADGIDVVLRLFPRGSDTQVIYVTGYDSYHSRVYETQHCGFLLKPVTQQTVDSALAEALKRRTESMERPVLVGSGGGEHVILPRDVLWVESDRRLLHIHLRGGDKVTTYLRLSQLSERFPTRFVQCHKSFLVNLDYVKAWSSDSLTMFDGTVIPVSQRRRTYTRNAVMQYARTVR